MRPAPAERGRGFDGTNIGSDFTEDEWRFAMAMDSYKRRTGRLNPTCAEVLEVAKSLGWRKHTQGVADE